MSSISTAQSLLFTLLDESESSNYLINSGTDQNVRKIFDFWLFLFSDASIHYLSSSPDSSGPQKYVGDIFGVSNSLLDQPYAKVQAGMEEMRKIVRGVEVSDRDTLVENLLKMLKSKKR